MPEISFATQPSSQVADVGEQVIFSANVNNTNTATTYQWKKNGSNLSNNSNYWGVNTNQLQVMNITNTLAGNYVLYVNGECNNLVSLTASLSVNTTSISNLNEMGVNIYPNPCNSNNGLHIDIENPTNFKIFGITGKEEVSGTLKNKSNTINISALPKGMHIIQLINENSILTQKILIK